MTGASSVMASGMATNFTASQLAAQNGMYLKQGIDPNGYLPNSVQGIFTPNGEKEGLGDFFSATPTTPASAGGTLGTSAPTPKADSALPQAAPVSTTVTPFTTNNSDTTAAAGLTGSTPTKSKGPSTVLNDDEENEKLG